MKIKPPTQAEIRLDDLKNEKAEVDSKLLNLDNFLFEHRGGLEYEEKRLLRVQEQLCILIQPYFVNVLQL